MAVPALPDGVLLQLHIPATGEVYRIAEDGRYLVTLPGQAETEQPPLSKDEPGRRTVSEQGLQRLRGALEAAGFFSLPDRVPTNESEDCFSADAVLPGSGRAVSRQPVVFSARGDGTVKTVEGSGDLRAPCTLGQLEPVYRALDSEAIGDWLGE